MVCDVCKKLILEHHGGIAFSLSKEGQFRTDDTTESDGNMFHFHPRCLHVVLQNMRVMSAYELEDAFDGLADVIDERTADDLFDGSGNVEPDSDINMDLEELTVATGNGGRVAKYEKPDTVKMENGRLLDRGKVKALFNAGWSLKEIALDVHAPDVSLVIDVLKTEGML